MARISMGYPDSNAEIAMLRSRETRSPLEDVAPVVSGQQLAAMIVTARNVFVSQAVEQYVVRISQATRSDPELRLGASPRATLQLVRAAKVRAALDGREFVLPDDINAIVAPVLAHRLIAANRSGGVSRASVAEIITRIVAHTPVPLGASGTVGHTG
jgi:MoxR-like ATPase